MVNIEQMIIYKITNKINGMCYIGYSIKENTKKIKSKGYTFSCVPSV